MKEILVLPNPPVPKKKRNGVNSKAICITDMLDDMKEKEKSRRKKRKGREKTRKGRKKEEQTQGTRGQKEGDRIKKEIERD